MSESDASSIVMYISRVMVSLNDDSWGVIYDRNIFTVQATIPAMHEIIRGTED